MLTKKEKDKLKDQIRRSIFLASEIKNLLLTNLDVADSKDFDELKKLFVKADLKQDKLIEKIVVYDKNFLTNIKNFKKTETRKIQKAVEKNERSQEHTEDMLKKL